ncbi:MAG: hypothetical protein ACREUW_01870 [Burkholderiales bacterium]
MRLVAACLLAAFTCAPVTTQAQVRKLEPVDEGAADPTWQQFRNRLMAALERKDAKAVLGTLDPKVRNGEGRPDGVAEFRKAWDFDKNPGSLYTELRRLLSLGSVYVREEKKPAALCAPYVTFKWPDDVDPLNHGAVLVRDALVKTKPGNRSDTVTTLGHDLVEVTDWEIVDEDPKSPQKWVKIVTRAGPGYLPEEQVRSAVEHRACFRRGANGWRMIVLLSGE